MWELGSWGNYLVGALILGLVFGFAFGSCIFAFLAPILGVVFREAAMNSGFSGLFDRSKEGHGP